MSTTITNLICITYQANPYVTAYHFVGKTLEEAQAKLDVFLKPKDANVDEISQSSKKIGESDLVLEVTHKGRGQANNGKIWLLNHKDQKRVRVDPAQVDEYVAKGFERGGPQVKFR